jgi:phage shock protein PspC (stress-responsive transcriptional regulator)
MNEVTRIHLGREPFTVAVEAHKSLKAYLADIEKKVHDHEVVSEVELRMAELLIERGITNDKVILPEDVQYLKDQLGDPADFSEDDKDTTKESSKPSDKTSRKLFRDTDTAIIAGVATGLANYSGIDVTIIRLLFVVLAIFGSGLGIAIYLVLWLAMPAAETVSEKLQMRGTPVTLEALKESVNKADMSGAAKRINNKLLPIINGLFRIAVKLIGIGFIFGGLAIVSAVSFAKAYMLLHDNRLFQENLFPVGLREQWLLAIVMGLAVIAAVFLFLAGVAALKRKWPVRGWVTGTLLAVFLVGSVATAALTADAIPRIRDRYETTLHTTAIKNIQPFTKVESTGDVDIEYISSPTYGVNIHYSDNPDLSKIKVGVSGDTLHVDSTKLDSYKHCTMLCLFPRYNMTVQVYAPNIENFRTPKGTDIFYPGVPVVPAFPVAPVKD